MARYWHDPEAGSFWTTDDDVPGFFVARYPAGTVEITAAEMPPIPVAAPLSLADRRADAVLPRETFAENAAMAGIITWDEATDWKMGNGFPAIIQPLIEETPASARGKLRFTLMRDNVRRTAPEIVRLGTMLGMTDAQVDALFGL